MHRRGNGRRDDGRRKVWSDVDEPEHDGRRGDDPRAFADRGHDRESLPFGTPRGFDEERDWRRAAYGTRTESVRDDFGGPYAGRGPAGYRRGDERICEEICEALTRHSYLDASRIHVEVKSGEVALSGNVASRAAKRLAEDLAEAASGVSEVRNEIRVQSHTGDSGTPQSGATAGDGQSAGAQRAPRSPRAADQQRL